LAPELLRFTGLSAHYGKTQALAGIELGFGVGERVGLFGHNGAGKSTLLRCAIGALRPSAGGVQFAQRPIDSGAVFKNARLGLGLVPQGHNVFRELSVERNLTVAGLQNDPNFVAEVYGLFPILRERRQQAAGSLSGGQQQMLALGMALMTQPRLLLLDEPCTGLAPRVVDDVLAALVAINTRRGTGFVLVEQNVRAALRVVERAVVLKSGRVVFDGAASSLAADADLWRWF
jgi:branched-chain amino acid transport system ATP-binding protein